MENYIGVKEINAKPMTRKAYKELRKTTELPDDHIHNDEELGYLVEYAADGGKANTEAYKGYVSWSPKEVFEKAYRKTSGMTFGLAVEAAKLGKKISRKGWNGKNMYVFYQKGYPDGIPANKNTSEALGIEEGTVVKIRPYLQMYCADGTFQMWLASQSDILADDWVVV